MRACRRCMLARARLHAPSAHATRKHCSLMSVSSPNTWQRPITPNPPPSAQRQLHQRTDRVKGVELHPTEPWCVRLRAQPMRDGQAGRDDGICCRCTRQCVSVCVCVCGCAPASLHACVHAAHAHAHALPPPSPHHPPPPNAQAAVQPVQRQHPHLQLPGQHAGQVVRGHGPAGAVRQVRGAQAVDRDGRGRHAHARVQLQHHGQGQGVRGAHRLHQVGGVCERRGVEGGRAGRAVWAWAAEDGVVEGGVCAMGRWGR